MRFLASEKLSKNKYIDNSGYLICQNAVLARTGKQTYLKSEIYPNCDDNSIIEIDRKPKEVFSDNTLASFENKPVTVEHPCEDVSPDNYRDLSVGYVRDVHKGSYNGEDVILGTLVITNTDVIDDIKNNIRTELSCGYTCDITEGNDPEQINIKGNHVALCEEGRAGIAKIVDTNKYVKAYDNSSKIDDNAPEYVIYVKEDNVWKVWGGSSTEQLENNWLSNVNKQHNTKYTEVQVVKNGEFVKDSTLAMLEPKDIDKYLIFEENGVFKGTPISNLKDGSIIRKNLVNRFEGFESFDEVIDFILDDDNFQYSREDIKIKDNIIEDDLKNFKKKKIELLKENLDNLENANFTSDDDDLEEYRKYKAKFRAYLRNEINK